MQEIGVVGKSSTNNSGGCCPSAPEWSGSTLASALLVPLAMESGDWSWPQEKGVSPGTNVV